MVRLGGVPGAQGDAPRGLEREPRLRRGSVGMAASANVALAPRRPDRDRHPRPARAPELAERRDARRADRGARSPPRRRAVARGDRHRRAAGLLGRRALSGPARDVPRGAPAGLPLDAEPVPAALRAGHHAPREPRAGDDRDDQRPRDRGRLRADARVRLPVGGGGGDARDSRGRSGRPARAWPRPRGSSAWWVRPAPRRSSWRAGGTRRPRRTRWVSSIAWCRGTSWPPRCARTPRPSRPSPSRPLAQVKARINAIARTGIPEVNAMTEGFLPRE